jgi:hypothetical protein
LRAGIAATADGQRNEQRKNNRTGNLSFKYPESIGMMILTLTAS